LLWVHELAAAFWKEAGEAEPFPRALRATIHRTLPLRVRYSAGLQLFGVRIALEKEQIFLPDDGRDRPLRACLAARYGHGFIFIDGTDPQDEQRFSLAHELAHFLRDYWQPRQRACRRLGEQVLAVFDGKRSPTHAERMDALLARVPIGFHVHLLERVGQNAQGNRAVARAEQEADLLAYELLAPASDVLAALEWEPQRDHSALLRMLQNRYGLPLAQAQEYSKKLMPPERYRDPLVQRIVLPS
jgi:Zn-dependent peptidase ImmA (M78 family)